MTFEHARAIEIRDVFAHHHVRYLFLGTSGVILLGYPGTTHDYDIFLEKSPQNRVAVVAALRELRFDLAAAKETEIRQDDFFVPLHNGPYAMDLNFSPQGIPSFEEAWARRVEVELIPVCHPDDIIASKKAANRSKDREALPRLQAFRDDWLKGNPRAGMPFEGLAEQISQPGFPYTRKMLEPSQKGG